MSLANGLLNGNILLSTSSLSEQSAQTAPIQAQNLGGGAQQLDQLESQIKALHQQALHTQATIQELETPKTNGFYSGFMSDTPWVLGAEGAVLGVGALILGGAIGGWYSWRRRRPLAKPASVAPDFADSRMYLGEQEPVAPPVASHAEADGTVATPPARVLQRHAAMEMDFAPSAPVAESDSVLNLFWAEAESTSPGPEEAEEDLLEPTRSPEASPFAPASPSLEFDREAAANEVERVRKSLAEKRDARARERIYDDAPRTVVLHAPINAGGFLQDDREEPATAENPPDSHSEDSTFGLSLGQYEAPQTDGVDLELDLALDADVDLEAMDSDFETVAPPQDFGPEAQDEEAQDEQEEVQEEAQDDGQAPPLALAVVAKEAESMVDFEFVATDEAQDTVPKLVAAEPPQDVGIDLEADEEPNPLVQFELAQEFQALGLLDGARELAMEVLGCSDAALKSQAQTLIDQLNVQETAQRVGELVDVA